MASVSEDTKRVKDQKERVEKIDFKMVTFRWGEGLRHRHYEGEGDLQSGEIHLRPQRGALCPGVHNLRGEIISIIDLRIMFHLTTEKKKEGALEKSSSSGSTST
jgi:purine-binding chemotaxis protein CheW